MTLHVFHHDDGIVDHQTDGKDDREQGEEIDREAEDLHEEHGPHERDRDCDDRDDGGAPRAQEKEDDEADDGERLDEGPEDVIDRGVDVTGAVEGDAAVHAGGQFLLDLLHLFRTRAITSMELAFGRTNMPMKTARSPEKRTSEL